MKPIVSVEVMQGREWVKRAMLRTIHKKPVSKELSDDTFSRLLMAEHSPIRQFRVWIDLDSLEDRVHTHIVRHRHTDCYVGSLREDWAKDLGIDLEDKKDEDGKWVRGMGWAMGADQLLHIARQRLCTCAYSSTRVAMNIILEEIRATDPILASYMLRPCVWYGFCPETKKYCGYMGTANYREQREWIVEESERLRGW